MEKWQQMFAPSDAEEKLDRLRSELGRSREVREALQDYLFSQWLVLNSLARRELNPEMKRAYLASADSLADLAGAVFRPSAHTTDRALPL